MSVPAAAAGNNLTFEEFQAINARAKASDRKAEQAAEQAAEAEEVPVVAAGGLGDFLEMPQVQSFVVFMIVVDVFASLFLVLLRLEDSGSAKAATDVTADGPLLDSPPLPLSLIKLISTYLVSTTVLQSALTSFTSFTALFFTLEMLAIILAFHIAVVGHLGYLLDCAVVGLQLYTGMLGSGVQFRLLSIFRFWRFMRLISARVAIEREAHEKTRALLTDKEGSLRALQGEVRRAEEELEKEKDARRAVDEMLMSYKDEVDTLNEALKIAAMDIAEVAEADDDLLLSDDEGEAADGESVGVGGGGSSAARGAGDDHDHDFVDASGSAYDKARNREALMREARRDAYNPQAAALRKAKESSTATFKIDEDGQWSKQ